MNLQGLLKTPYFSRYLTRIDKFVLSCVCRALFYTIDRETDKIDLFSACIAHSSLEVLNWLKPREIEERHVELAIRYRKDDMLKQFLDSGIMCNVAELAAIWGRKDLLDRMPFAWKFINVARVLESGNHWLIPDHIPLREDYLRDCDTIPFETLKWFYQNINLYENPHWVRVGRKNIESIRYLFEIVGFTVRYNHLLIVEDNDDIFDYLYPKCNLDKFQFVNYAECSNFKHFEKVLRISKKFTREEQMDILLALLNRDQFQRAAYLFSRGFSAHPEAEKKINQFRWNYEGLFKKIQFE